MSFKPSTYATKAITNDNAGSTLTNLDASTRLRT
jgi:hypothetical protein